MLVRRAMIVQTMLSDPGSADMGRVSELEKLKLSYR